MARILTVLSLIVLISAATSTAEQTTRVAVEWMPTHSSCSGPMAECLDGDEFVMDSVVTRRILATTNYISYGALKRDTVPCSVRGASYYNCRPGAQANPYVRGCSAITRCRS